MTLSFDRELAAIALGAAALSASYAMAQSTPSLRIDQVVVTPSRGQAPSAGYFVVSNPGRTADRLIAASSPRAARIELHDMTTSGGMMRMTPLTNGAEAPAGGELRFARGGKHLMIYGAAPPLRSGERVPLTLTFERAGDLRVMATVE